ncbi:hypothetical protein M388_00270 [Mesotoga sp. Brook.08.YT.4.2.5.4.]|nr:hypothetical protein M388_00270 [Mesotoga sp. Brook.08.YT.4.2.5.4.]
MPEGYKRIGGRIFPESWSLNKIKDFAKTKSGKTPDRDRHSEFYQGGNLNWFKTGELLTKYLSNSEEKITPKALALCGMPVFPKRSIILAMYGATIGKASILDENSTTNQACCCIFPSSSYDTEYIFYQITFNREAFVKISAGAAQPNINQSLVQNFCLPLCETNEQNRIAEILSTCDRVIDLKKKLIEDKKKVKKWLMQTLLTGMIRVKDIENGTPYEELKKRIEQIRRGKVPQGYDRNGILGIIPEEWQVFQMSRIISTLTDFVANGSFASLRANVKYLRKQDYAVLLRLEDHSNDYKGEFVYVDMYSYQFLRKSVLKPGDIIIANVGARCGFVFRAPSLKLPMTLGPNAILLRTNQDDYWVYYFLSSSIGQSQLSQIKGTSAQPKFNKTDFRSLSICLPEIAEQIRIAEILSTADTEIDLLNKDLEQWELKKKSLMQLLLTGIVRVNAEN